MTDVALLGGAITLINLCVLWLAGRAATRAGVSHVNAAQATARAASYASTARGHADTAMRAALGRVGLMMRYDEAGKPVGPEVPFTHDGLDDVFTTPPEHDPLLPEGFRDDVVRADFPLTTLHIDERGRDQS